MRKPRPMYYAKIPCLRALELNGKSSQFLAIAVINCDYFREKNNIGIMQFAFKKKERQKVNLKCRFYT